jgi:23S rRNA (uracil1939-C5)-methyltransferase
VVVFVNGGVPGDVADIRIRKTKRRFFEAEIEKLVSPSPEREMPFCSHFGTCGGCKWQHLAYEKQLFYKQQQVADSIERIGKVKPEEYHLLDILGSEETTFYRNKLEFTFTSRRWLTKQDIDTREDIADPDGLGFHVPGFFDKVLDVEKCWLQPEPSNQIRVAVKKFALENNLSFFDFKTNEGLLRNIIIRNTVDGKFMVCPVFGQNKKSEIKKLLNFIKDSFDNVVSLWYFVNDKKNTSLNDLEPIHFWGDEALVEKMEDLSFSVGPKSFFQTNAKQALNLYSIAREMAALNGSELVYDLYTGTGTIVLFVARNAAKVVGLEYVEEAVEHARQNAATNGIENSVFVAGDMAKIFTADLFAEHGKPDVIITDPPRAGMHPKVVEAINNSGAKRIVYVSCNPATQARDIDLLSEFYSLEKVQPVDMFPHTHHVESVALLVRRG